jgi:hypothetical protein
MADAPAEVTENDLIESEAVVDIPAEPEDWNTEHGPAQAINSDNLDLSSLQALLEAATNDSHHHGHDQEGAESILELQEHLDSLPGDDPTRPMQLFLLGCAIADHHVEAEIPGLGDMPRAIALLEEAIAANPDDHNARRSYCNALQNMCWSVYQNTRDQKYLEEGIKYGHLAVGPKFPSDIEDPHTLLSQRYAIALARSLKERFEMASLDNQKIEDLDESIGLLMPAIAGESSFDHETRLPELCSLLALKSEVTRDFTFIDMAIGFCRGHSIDVHRGGWTNLQGLIALLGRRYEWTMEPMDLDNLVQMTRLVFLPEVGQHPDYTVPLEYMACISSLPYHREGKKLFDLDTAICLHTIALLEIKRDWPINLKRRRDLLEEVSSLLDDRWKLKGEVRDGYAADEADIERAQIESILPLLGDGTRPLAQCGPIGVCASYRSRVTGEDRTISGFRMVFRRTLKEGEEREESDAWSSSVPEASNSDADSIHSGDERSVNPDCSPGLPDKVNQEQEVQNSGDEEDG